MSEEWTGETMVEISERELYEFKKQKNEIEESKGKMHRLRETIKEIREGKPSEEDLETLTEILNEE